MITIREAAALADVSKDKCRYWLKLLDLEMVKQDGKLLLPGNAVNLLQAMKKIVDSGVSPVAAAVEVKSIHALPVVQEVNQDNNTADKIADLQKAVLLLASTVEKQNQILGEQSQLLSEQSKQLAALSTKLLPPPVEVKPVKVWQPIEKPAPKVSWLKRAWLELINPTALRATP